jgi:hypothetical protein
MSDPHSDMQKWGHAQAIAVGLDPVDVTYDSEMLHFQFATQPKFEKIKELKQRCIDSKYIKLPYIITYIEETTDDFDDLKPDEVVWTMGFYNTENDRKV